jgi:hypothetical protein
LFLHPLTEFFAEPLAKMLVQTIGHALAEFLAEPLAHVSVKLLRPRLPKA